MRHPRSFECRFNVGLHTPLQTSPGPRARSCLPPPQAHRSALPGAPERSFNTAGNGNHSEPRCHLAVMWGMPATTSAPSPESILPAQATAGSSLVWSVCGIPTLFVRALQCTKKPWSGGGAVDAHQALHAAKRASGCGPRALPPSHSRSEQRAPLTGKRRQRKEAWRKVVGRMACVARDGPPRSWSLFKWLQSRSTSRWAAYTKCAAVNACQRRGAKL